LFELLLIIGIRATAIAATLAAGMSNIRINPTVAGRANWFFEDRKYLPIHRAFDVREVHRQWYRDRRARLNISDEKRRPKEVGMISTLIILFSPPTPAKRRDRLLSHQRLDASCLFRFQLTLPFGEGGSSISA
jgi:hypothetical protein